jgi:hypothetical protein
MVPGARIELATPAFSGRRSTNELPRLFGLFNFRDDSQRCQFGAPLSSEPVSNMFSLAMIALGIETLAQPEVRAAYPRTLSNN